MRVVGVLDIADEFATGDVYVIRPCVAVDTCCGASVGVSLNGALSPGRRFLIFPYLIHFYSCYLLFVIIIIIFCKTTTINGAE